MKIRELKQGNGFRIAALLNQLGYPDTSEFTVKKRPFQGIAIGIFIRAERKRIRFTTDRDT
jgi:hypothetical protein